MTSLTYTSIDITPVKEFFEAMAEKGQDQIPDEGFLMTERLITVSYG